MPERSHRLPGGRLLSTVFFCFSTIHSVRPFHLILSQMPTRARVVVIFGLIAQKGAQFSFRRNVRLHDLHIIYVTRIYNNFEKYALQRNREKLQFFNIFYNILYNFFQAFSLCFFICPKGTCAPLIP